MSSDPHSSNPGRRIGQISWGIGVGSGLVQAVAYGWGSSRDLEYGPAVAVGIVILLSMCLNMAGIWLGLVAQAASRKHRAGLSGLWINGMVLAGMFGVIAFWLVRG